MVDLTQHGYDTATHSFEGLVGDARIVDIYDGDTLQVVLDDRGVAIKVKCRLSGIDTCEIRARNPENRRLAYAARDRIVSLATGKPIDEIKDASRKTVRRMLESEPVIARIACDHDDKWGRTLVKVYDRSGDTQSGASSFGHVLLQEGLAYRYHGGRKLSESEQLDVLRHQSDDPPATSK